MTAGVEDGNAIQWAIKLLEPFRLLDLDPELCLRIYEFAVTEPEPIKILDYEYGPLNPFGPINYTYAQQPSLASTYRSIRKDALKYYYKYNTFYTTFYYLFSTERAMGFLAEWFKGVNLESWVSVRSLLLQKCRHEY